MKCLLTLLILLNIGCSLFNNESEFSCDNLVVTSEEGAFAIEIKGDPSNQWTVAGIENPEMPEECNEGEECERIGEYEVSPAYPNPISSGNNTSLSFSLPAATKLRVLANQDSFQEEVLNQILPKGQHRIIFDTEDGERGCYKIEYFFGESEKPNAYGLLLVN